ncbi:MAG: DUF58 domain-containing protein [Syntrophomonas sp.]
MTTAFDQDFLKRLKNLSLVSRHIRAGKNAGNRRSPVKGHSVEFADFRSYSPGDDIRYLDWNSYARSEKLFIKLFMEEQDLLLNIFFDQSLSMDWGEPSKGQLARHLAAAFSYLSLNAYDRVSISSCGERLAGYLPPQRGRAGLDKAWAFLDNIAFQGQTDLNRSLREFGRYSHGAGLSVLFSDLLTPLGFQDGLKYLQYLKQDIVVIQILSPDELDPVLHGDWRLLDSENGELREITAGPRVLKAYRNKLQSFIEENRSFCGRRGISFLQVCSDEPFDQIILAGLTKAGVIG